MKQTETNAIYTPAIRAAAALLAVFLCLLAPGAAAGQTAEQTAQTALLVYADEEGLAGLHLVVTDLQAGRLSVLSIPLSTRAMVNRCSADGTPEKAVYAPIRQAWEYGGNDPVGNVAASVQRLLGGPPVDRVAAFSPQTLEQLVDAVGGIRLHVSDLPAAELVPSRNTQGVYPDAQDNSGLAIALKRELDRMGSAGNYEMDVGRALAGKTPAVLSGTDITTALFSGQDAVAIVSYGALTDYDGTDIMQIRRQQSVLIALVSRIKQKGVCIDADALDGLFRCDPGPSILQTIAQFDQAAIDTAAVFPAGIDREYGDQVHWIFDTVWLRSWLLENIYGITLT